MASFTYAPLPKWLDLFKAIALQPEKEVENKLSAIWNQNHIGEYWLSRSAWSLYLIAKFRIKVSQSNRITIWFPAYFCNASLIPLRQLGIKIKFYPLLSITKANINGCKEMLTTGQPDIIIIAHFFGEAFLAQPLFELALSEGAWLVEDCVHCLKPDKSLGNYGDFVLYSPHKLFPIPDGAVLLISKKGPASISEDLLTNYKFNTLYKSLINQPKPILSIVIKWLIKRSLQKLGVRGKKTNNKFYNDKQRNTDCIPHPSMSNIARILLSLLVQNIDSEAKHRLFILQTWNSSMKENGVFPDFKAHSSALYSPYLASVVFNNSNEAKKYYSLLNNSGVPVSTWPDLPPEVYNSPDQQQVSIEMRNNRFYLPVHNSITAAGIIKIIQCIR
jgi:hypothetical protein|tara:strand:- start:3959 stop:5122 length:1164 start_codon:yes stop_codon:yes gene_type:complete